MAGLFDLNRQETITGGLIDQGLLDDIPAPSELRPPQGLAALRQPGPRGFTPEIIRSMSESLRGADLQAFSSTGRTKFLNRFIQTVDDANPDDTLGQIDETFFIRYEKVISKKIKDLRKIADAAVSGELSPDILGQSVADIMTDLIGDIETAETGRQIKAPETPAGETRGTAQVFEQALQGEGNRVTKGIINGEEVDILGNTGFFTTRDEQGNFVFKRIRPELDIPEPPVTQEFRPAIAPQIPLARTAESFRREEGRFQKFSPEELAEFSRQERAEAVQQQQAAGAAGRERRAVAGERRAEASAKRAGQPKTFDAALLDPDLTPGQRTKLLGLKKLAAAAGRKPEDIFDEIFKFQKLRNEANRMELSKKELAFKNKNLDLANRQLNQTIAKAKGKTKLKQSDFRSFAKNVETGVLVPDPDNDKLSVVDTNAAWIQFPGLGVLLDSKEEREALFREFVSKFGGEAEVRLLRQHINEIVELGFPD